MAANFVAMPMAGSTNCGMMAQPAMMNHQGMAIMYHPNGAHQAGNFPAAMYSSAPPSLTSSSVHGSEHHFMLAARAGSGGKHTGGPAPSTVFPGISTGHQVDLYSGWPGSAAPTSAFAGPNGKVDPLPGGGTMQVPWQQPAWAAMAATTMPMTQQLQHMQPTGAVLPGDKVLPVQAPTGQGQGSVQLGSGLNQYPAFSPWAQQQGGAALQLRHAPRGTPAHQQDLQSAQAQAVHMYQAQHLNIQAPQQPALGGKGMETAPPSAQVKPAVGSGGSSQGATGMAPPSAPRPLPQPAATGKAEVARRQVEKGLAGKMADPSSGGSNMSDASSAATLDSRHVQFLTTMPACDLPCPMKRRHELRRGLKRFFKHVDLRLATGPVSALPPVLLHQLVQMHDESLDNNIANNCLADGAHAFVALLRSLLYEALRVAPKQRVAARHAVMLQVTAHSRHPVAYVAYTYTDESDPPTGLEADGRGRNGSWDGLQPAFVPSGDSGATLGRVDEPGVVSTSPLDREPCAAADTSGSGGNSGSGSGSSGSQGGGCSTTDDGTSCIQPCTAPAPLRDSDSAQSNRTQDGSDGQQARAGGSSGGEGDGDGASGASRDTGPEQEAATTARGQAVAKSSPHCRATLAASRSLGTAFGVRLHGSDPRTLGRFMSHRTVRFSNSASSETSGSSDSSVEHTPVVQHHVALRYLSGVAVMARMKAIRQSVHKTCSSYVFRGTYMRQVAGGSVRSDPSDTSGSNSGSDSLRRSGSGNPWCDPAGGTDPSAGSAQSNNPVVFQPFPGTEAVALQWAEWRGAQSLDGMCVHFQAADMGVAAGAAPSAAAPKKPSSAQGEATAPPAQVHQGAGQQHHNSAVRSPAPPAPPSLSSRSSGKTSTVL